jgi:hypothetical protein
MKPGLLILAALSLSVGLLRAQYSLDWYSVDGGGGVSSGGSYTLSGTIGQPDAGTMSGGPYTLAGGFWSIISSVATSGAPQLSISLTHTNTVLVSWPSAATGFVLQHNTSLAPLSWQLAPQTPIDNGVVKSILVAPSSGTAFYRLVK